MSEVEDISDDNNEDVDEKSGRIILFDEHQSGNRVDEPVANSKEGEAGDAPLAANTEVTAEDVEHCRMDDGIGSSKADNTDDALQAIAMSPCHIQSPGLPDGWVSIQHASGATVYFHRESRVCTWGMPYTIKKGVTVKLWITSLIQKCISDRDYRKQKYYQKHQVPIWSIPCLQEWLFKDPEADHVKRWKQVEQKQKKSTPLARISPELVEEYLCRRWQMKSVAAAEIEKNATSYVPPAKKRKSDSSCLPKTLSHLVTVQIPDHLRKSALRIGCKSVPKEWTVNTGTKSAVQILHEFVHICPVGMLEYKLSECRKATAPYVCTTLINKISYGQASSLSKKQAKQLAAEKTLETLLPNTFTMFKKKTASTDDYQYFAGVSIEDPRLAVMCDKAGLPLPYNILVECVQRHQGILPDTELTFSVKNDEANNLQYHMSLGKTHQVTGPCTNKKEGKQLASQALIKELHPFVNDWATIMNMYANTWKYFDSKQKVIPEHESLKTQQKSGAAKLPAPDQAVLKKLQDEMRKLSKASSTAPTDFRERHLIMTNTTLPIKPTSES